MNMIQIRSFCDGDEAPLYEIFHSAVHELASAHYTFEQLNAWAPPNIDLEKWYGRIRLNRPFVAVINGEIAGFADVQDKGYIDQFFVSPRYARHGVGTKIMGHIHQVAAANGMVELTSDVSLTAEPFFLRFGFEVIERRLPERRGIVLQNAFMRKKLSSDSRFNPDTGR